MELIEFNIAERLLVSGDQLFNGRELLPDKGLTLEICGGLVQLISPDSSDDRLGVASRSTRDDRLRVIDGVGCTILPGLIDCHVHLALDGKDFQGALASWQQPEQLLPRVKQDLAATLNFGVVAVRDGGDSDWVGLETRNMVNSDQLVGPQVVATGNAIRKQGRYGTFLGRGLSSGELPAAINRMKKLGVDQIKVLVSGVVSFKEYQKVGELQFDLRELKEIVSCAAGEGLMVMAHASSDGAVQLCINAGVGSIEHGYFLSKRSLEAMAERGIPWIPTVVPVANQTRGDLGEKCSSDSRQVIERTYRRQLEMINTAYRLGVQLGVGTDAGATGVLHGEGFHQEMALYQEAGLPLEAILQAATVNGAAILGKIEQFGMIATGHQATLLVVEGDPLTDISALKRIKYLVRPRPVAIQR